MIHSNHKNLTWHSHKGKDILKIDDQFLTPVEQLEQLDVVEALYKELPFNMRCLVTDITENDPTDEALKKRVETSKKHPSCYISAVGVAGLQKTLVKTMNPRIHFANSGEYAMDWLVER